MTETTSGPARGSRSKGNKGGKGLRIERVHTTPGVHPYDEVVWERRDVVMTNWRDGSINFEQRGVEFPDFWSVNAVNIVTSKYFRGAVGSPERESGLKQLIDRVVSTYRKAGEEHGYFASPADAEIFDHELTYALLHQVFSFNSPVWFNVGTAQPQQVSACFILSVDDSMESILDWYKEEGMIFKGGSGAGLNLSRIRSSQGVALLRRQRLRSGLLHARRRRVRRNDQVGRRHPPRGQDGRPRCGPPGRRGLHRHQGEGGGEGPRPARRRVRHGPGRRRHHLRPVPERQQLRPRQRRVHEGRRDTASKFGLRSRMSGEVIEEVDAKALFRKMAEAAWACADPGIQYDDTINHWHTSPETGRITASNPCSEYMHLDNSSCNLASLNLMKFLRDDDQGNQSFDAERFAKVVELVITGVWTSPSASPTSSTDDRAA
ncbi:hypothetical protein GCM10020221_32820 [Streptomyces thioluteus]|uniref:Uncharacterized protein n=1 Tax=Streptomyces thioluteus TaxID=66431 RepID=A0ABN3X3G9_STRTU